MFKNIFSFRGRIRRTEFGISYIIYLIYAVFMNVIGDTIENSIGVILVLVSLIPMLWFLWAQSAKRCHDRGNSGWYQIIPFYVLWMIFADSDKGPNEYGDNPKGIGNYEDINEIGKPIEID